MICLKRAASVGAASFLQEEKIPSFRVQGEEQDASHSLAVFLPNFRETSKKFKPAWLEILAHFAYLSSSTASTEVSLLSLSNTNNTEDSCQTGGSY